ncbi:hypothetical protein EG68_09687 [Paragonimus skrjabini miyazakii]|uniref:Uncharacterized protein n=1 Tax=Paragonimus skrjabini miyazakii TaxID=59628 RepID=A0A8S9YLY0_9TREM|nr:hypothetical protein EG68_09687 [Paragonimus skrjabini miyazakii]
MLLDRPQFVETDVVIVRSTQYAVMSRVENHAYRQKIFTTLEEFRVLYCTILLTNCTYQLQTSKLSLNETLHENDPRIRTDFVIVATDSTIDSDHSHGTVVHIFPTVKSKKYYDRLRVKQVNIFKGLNNFGPSINMFNVNAMLNQQDNSLLSLAIPRGAFKQYGVHRASTEYEVRHQGKLESGYTDCILLYTKHASIRMDPEVVLVGQTVRLYSFKDVVQVISQNRPAEWQKVVWVLKTKHNWAIIFTYNWYLNKTEYGPGFGPSHITFVPPQNGSYGLTLILRTWPSLSHTTFGCFLVYENTSINQSNIGALGNYLYMETKRPICILSELERPRITFNGSYYKHVKIHNGYLVKVVLVENLKSLAQVSCKQDILYTKCHEPVKVISHFTVELHLKIKQNGRVHDLPLYDQRDDTMIQSRTFIYGAEVIRLMDGTWHGTILACETRIMSRRSMEYVKKVLRSSLIQLHTPYSKIQILLDGIKPLSLNNSIVHLERQINLTCMSDSNIGRFAVRWSVQLSHSNPAGITQAIRTGSYGTSKPGQPLNLSLPYVLTLEEEVYTATCVLYAPGARLPNPSSAFVYFSPPTLNYNHHWIEGNTSWILQHVIFGSVTFLIILLATVGPILATKLAGDPLHPMPQPTNRFLQGSIIEPLNMRYRPSNRPHPARTSTVRIVESRKPNEPLKFAKHEMIRAQPRATFSIKRNRLRRKLRPVGTTVISRRTYVPARSHRYRSPKRTIELKVKSARRSPETNFILNICRYFIVNHK